MIDSVAEPFSHCLDYVPELLDIIAEYPRQYPFLLDSAALGPLGRYSLLLRAGPRYLSLERNGELTGPGDADRFLDRLKHWYVADATKPSDHSQGPFVGGWFVYLGYELAGEIEPVLDLPAAQEGLPVALAVRCEGAIIIEHGVQVTARLVAESPQILDQMYAEIERVPARAHESPPTVERVMPEPEEDFNRAVARIQKYLREGDVFQVNLSRAWQGTFDVTVDAVGIYRRLRRSNPAPFAGLMIWGEETLMSSSPERLVDVRGSDVQTRPIAGTYPRGLS